MIVSAYVVADHRLRTRLQLSQLDKCDSFSAEAGVWLIVIATERLTHNFTRSFAGLY